MLAPGFRIGRWELLRAVTRCHWLCRCDCGKERVVIGKTLRSKKSQSCGCSRHVTRFIGPIRKYKGKRLPEWLPAGMTAQERKRAYRKRSPGTREAAARQETWAKYVADGRAAIWAATNRARNREKMLVMAAKMRARRKATPGTGATLSEWREICASFGGCCGICLRPAKLTMDHFRPISRGGEHSVDNLVPLCAKCNGSKGAKLIFGWLPLLSRRSISRVDSRIHSPEVASSSLASATIQIGGR